MPVAAVTQAGDITVEMIETYQSQGFIHIHNLLTLEEVKRYHDGAIEASETMANYAVNTPLIFNQTVNVWKQNPIIRELTLHPRIAAIATRLARVPLRIWHDHTLIKPPRRSSPTEFHQDGPYWPHHNRRNALSAWVALVDVPVERGCMTFIPGSHLFQDLRAQDLSDSRDFLSLVPDMNWSPRVTVPLHAGDCTFHHSYIAHMANANVTEVPRVAHIIIYMDSDTTYNGNPHVITDPLNLRIGAPLDGDSFPKV
jgi:phytanoyl-CoA hydroxylase